MNKIDFVGLHAHSGVGSPFDGFGHPQEHMDYAFENGSNALALTSISGIACQKDAERRQGVQANFWSGGIFYRVRRGLES